MIFFLNRSDRTLKYNVQHYDKASFLSGKLQALLTRPYLKGRDLYDLFWYLSDPEWPGPNIGFLNAALAQTKWKGLKITSSNWCSQTADRLKSIDWEKAVEDTRPFIENASDLELLTKDNVVKMLMSRGV